MICSKWQVNGGVSRTEKAGWRERQFKLGLVLSPEPWTISHEAGEGVELQPGRWWEAFPETARVRSSPLMSTVNRLAHPDSGRIMQVYSEQNKQLRAQGQSVEQKAEEKSQTKNRSK